MSNNDFGFFDKINNQNSKLNSDTSSLKSFNETLPTTSSSSFKLNNQNSYIYLYLDNKKMLSDNEDSNSDNYNFDETSNSNYLFSKMSHQFEEDSLNNINLIDESKKKNIAQYLTNDSIRMKYIKDITHEPNHSKIELEQSTSTSKSGESSDNSDNSNVFQTARFYSENDKRSQAKQALIKVLKTASQRRTKLVIIKPATEKSLKNQNMNNKLKDILKLSPQNEKKVKKKKRLNFKFVNEINTLNIAETYDSIEKKILYNINSIFISNTQNLANSLEKMPNPQFIDEDLCIF
jgi:hypothetical protein